MIPRDVAINLYHKHVNTGLARLFRLMNSGMEIHSERNTVVDDRGNHYVDCGGYCVFFLGHRHPRVCSAVRQQLETHPISTRVLINPQFAQAAETVVRVALPGLDFVWFGSSGAEAVDTAVKLARCNGKRRIISMEGGFHGKSIGALSVSANERYRAPFLPLLDDVVFVPYGNISALESALSTTDGDAAVIMEPIQSEAGVRIPSTGYLSAVSDTCHRYEALLIMDEISTGLGRVGHWWGSLREPCAPDILLAGKALGGGIMPVSAVLSSKKVYAPFNREPLLHTSTFAGNPMACAAVIAAIETIIDEELIQKSEHTGQRLLREIRNIVSRIGGNTVREVRGVGLLIGLEFYQEHCGAEFMLEMMKNRVLVSHSLNAHHVVRLTPPANVSEQEIGQIVEAVETSLTVVESRYGCSVERGRSHATR